MATDIISEFYLENNENTDPLEGMYGNPFLTTFLAVSTVLIETAGNVLLLAIITYEKYGVDPQKRTVMNQLLAQLCTVLILGNVLSFPGIVLRYFSGPLSKQHKPLSF